VEYLIYCDESISKGRYFSNFYGGALVRAQDLLLVERSIRDCRDRLHLDKEMKWSKVTSQYLEKYTEMIDVFFDLVEADRIKLRIMFTQNRYRPTSLTGDQVDNEYFLLYYQFIKHAFGLAYADAVEPSESHRVRLYLDRLPDTKEKVAQFKRYLVGLNDYRQFKNAKVYIDPNQIAEIESHQHVILQGLDVVLGSMQFRLNDRHLEKPEGDKVRGKRTIAKEKLYKHISRRIRKIYPRFNIGVSTSAQGNADSHWRHPYRHWLFIPSDHEVVREEAPPEN
jgi:Protein of unknown function (DUF3800)